MIVNLPYILHLTRASPDLHNYATFYIHDLSCNPTHYLTVTAIALVNGFVYIVTCKISYVVVLNFLLVYFVV